MKGQTHLWAREPGFAILQLIPQREFARSFREPWENRGPVFSKKGTPEKDWDDSRVPVWIVNVQPQKVFDGGVIKAIRGMTRPLLPQIYAAAKKKHQAVNSRLDSFTHEAGDRLYRRGARGGAGAPIIARKFIEPSENELKLRAGELNFDRLLPPAPTGGWDKVRDLDQGDPADLGEIRSRDRSKGGS